MLEEINETINVIAAFTPPDRGAVKVVPHIIEWRGKRYRLEEMGLYYPEQRGKRRVHTFSFLSAGVTFRIELDPESLVWTLVEVYYAS